MKEKIKIYGNNGFIDAIETILKELIDFDTKNTIFIQSPLIAENLCDIFPLWLEYYRYHGWLNKPWKIIVIGVESQYESLPYYVQPCQKQNLWDRVEQLLQSEAIDYSHIPDTCSGKAQVSVFFHGHGEMNIKGILSRIFDFIRTGIYMIQEGEDFQQLEEIYFKPAVEYLGQLKERLKKYKPLLDYLPWDQEMVQTDQMISLVDRFLKDPLGKDMTHSEILSEMGKTLDSFSQLMEIHGIEESR